MSHFDNRLSCSRNAVDYELCIMSFAKHGTQMAPCGSNKESTGSESLSMVPFLFFDNP